MPEKTPFCSSEISSHALFCKMMFFCNFLSENRVKIFIFRIKALAFKFTVISMYYADRKWIKDAFNQFFWMIKNYAGFEWKHTKAKLIRYELHSRPIGFMN